MRVLGRKRLDHLIERSGSTSNTNAETFAQLDQGMDNVVGM